VDTIRTGKNGVAVSKPLPLARYEVIESQAADFYGLDKTPIEVEIEYAGQIVKAVMTNKSLYTNVAIQKTGYAEVMPDQNIRYSFSGIANNSTTSLTSFYWRDTLPVEAVRLAKITTGTYNAAGNYKIVYKTNLSGSEYRVLADSLNTQQNYVLDASPVALRLASNEYVTEVMFVFGVVPANFRQVETPMIDCSVVSWAKGGSQFVNQADVQRRFTGEMGHAQIHRAFYIGFCLVHAGKEHHVRRNAHLTADFQLAGAAHFQRADQAAHGRNQKRIGLDGVTQADGFRHDFAHGAHARFQLHLVKDEARRAEALGNGKEVIHVASPFWRPLRRHIGSAARRGRFCRFC